MWRCSPNVGPGAGISCCWSGGVGGGSGGVGAAGGGGPGVVAGLVLVQAPAGGLFGVVVVPAAGSGVARAGPAAFFPGHGVLEVAGAGVPAARRPGALPVPDFYQVAEPVAGLVSGGLVPVVAAGDGERADVDGVVPAGGAGGGQPPPAVPAWAGRPVVVLWGEGGAVPVPGRRCPVVLRAGGAGRAQPWAVGWPCWSVMVTHQVVRGLVAAACGEGAGEVGVDGAEAVGVAGPVGQAEQGGQRDGQVDPGGRAGRRRGRRGAAGWPGAGGPVGVPPVPAVGSRVRAGRYRRCTAQLPPPGRALRRGGGPCAGSRR